MPKRRNSNTYLYGIHKPSWPKNAVIPAGIAGQIGRTADLHGSAARRVRDMEVPNASRSHGGQLAVEQMFVQQISSLQLHIPMDWIPAIPAGMTRFQHLMMAPA